MDKEFTLLLNKWQFCERYVSCVCNKHLSSGINYGLLEDKHTASTSNHLWQQPHKHSAGNATAVFPHPTATTTHPLCPSWNPHSVSLGEETAAVQHTILHCPGGIIKFQSALKLNILKGIKMAEVNPDFIIQSFNCSKKIPVLHSCIEYALYIHLVEVHGGMY